MSSKKRPDYRVMASRDSDDRDDRLVEIGIGFESTSSSGRRYIAVVLNARPWGTWDGQLKLFPIAKDSDAGPEKSC